MSWWEAAPLAPSSSGGGNWWDAAPLAPSAGNDLDRKAALGVQGTRVGILNTLGAPVDLAAAGLRQAGLPVNNPVGGSQSLNQAADWVASLPGKIAPNTFSSGQRLTPETTGEKAIYGAGEGVGTALATMIPAGAIARTAAPAVQGAVASTPPSLTQSVAQTLAAQPGMQLASAATGGAVTGATDNPYLGLAAGVGLPIAAGLGSRAISPMGPARTAAETERRRLVDVLRNNPDNPVPLTTGDITGNRGIQTLESVLETLLLSGPLQRGLRDRQGEAANRLVTSHTGDPIPAFTQAEREGRRQELGQTFQNLARGTTVNLDQPFVTQLNDTLTRYRQQLDPDVYRNVEQRLEQLINAATQPGNPQIPGEIYQRIRSSLSQQATNMGNREGANALRDMRNALDAAARRSLPPDVAQEWDTVRRQWGNLRTIENGMRNTDAAVGNISPKALGQAVDTANRRGGSQDMTETSNALRKVLGDKMAQSGTQPRSYWQDVATGAPLIGATAYGTGGNTTAMIASLLAAPTVQVALENPATRAWVANRLLGNVPTLPSGEMVGRIGLVQALDNMDRATAPNGRNGRKPSRRGATQ